MPKRKLTHRERFEEALKKVGPWATNHEYRALLYLLTSEPLYLYMNDCYDFKTRRIKPDAVCAAFQTGSSARMTRLALNLYTCNKPTNDEDWHDYLPSSLFCGLDRSNIELMLNALRIYCNMDVTF